MLVLLAAPDDVTQTVSAGMASQPMVGLGHDVIVGTRYKSKHGGRMHTTKVDAVTLT